MQTIRIPPGFVAQLQDRPADPGLGVDGVSGAAWLRRLPALIEQRLDDWALTISGAPMHGVCAVVVPVTRGGDSFMLKLSWPHAEAAREHLALRHWAGVGAVRLIAAHPASYALLVESLDADRDLTNEPIDDACAVIGGLLGRLHVTAPPTIPSFTDVVGRWLAPLRLHPSSLPRSSVDRALHIVDSRPHGDRLLHTDLHYENVLAAERDDWLTIDPKPIAGPPGFELYPALRNRTAEYGTGSTLRWQVRRRVEVLSEAAGIDWDDAREWSIVRAVLNAFEDARDGDQAAATLHLAIASALTDP